MEERIRAAIARPSMILAGLGIVQGLGEGLGEETAEIANKSLPLSLPLSLALSLALINYPQVVFD